MSEESLKTDISDNIYNRGDLFERRFTVVYSVNGGERVVCKLEMHCSSNVIHPSAAEIALELYRQGEVEVIHEAFINAHDINHVIVRGNLDINIHDVVEE